ncbi:MAG: helix-turn-helix domain-containing protein [Erysipelotrichales bacterium]|nr:helix-turn-helix domain-containing protein [Erysipelotrichales bacterium]
MDIRNKLIELRRNADLTQVELAKKINYSDKVISKWERGECLPDIVALNVLAEFYGISLDDLIKNNKESLKNSLFKSTNYYVLNLRLPLLMLHILILLSGLVMYLFALSLFDVLGNSNIIMSYKDIVTFVVAGIIILLAVVDLIFVYLRKDRLLLTIVMFIIFCLMFIFLGISFVRFGHRVIIPIRSYLVYFHLIILTSVIYGYIVKLKIIDKF